jgi:hypothetical protein
MARGGCLLLLALLVLVPSSAARAQSPVMSIPRLEIALWPDYDQPSVLVMLTADLGAGTPLPAVVALPLPADARLNAVARIDENGDMLADVPYQTGPGQITLTVPSPRLRVEYYAPYRVEGDQRSFTYTWLADLPVERLDLTVQRPTSAGSLSTEPAALNVGSGGDGLVYHVLPAQVVPAGRSFSVRVAYAMAAPRLSVASQSEAGGASPPPASSSPATPSGWLQPATAVAAVLAAAAVTWAIARRGSPRAARTSRQGDGGPAPRFCAACGKPLTAGGRFCSHCGEAVPGG